MGDLEEIAFDGSVAGITGGASGIGKATCETFASLGANISIADVDTESAHEVADEIESEYNVDTLVVETDVTSYDDASEWVNTTIEKLGHLEILINNAGGNSNQGAFTESTPDDWDFTVGLCFFGTLNCTHAALEHMTERGSGVIINFASDSYKGNDPDIAVYGASKAANVSFTQTVAKEVGKQGVRMNCVSPGTTWTPPIEEALERVGDSMVEEYYALDRLGQPEDIANMVAFLSSDAADWVTGEVVSVNGGYLRG